MSPVEYTVSPPPSASTSRSTASTLTQTPLRSNQDGEGQFAHCRKATGGGKPAAWLVVPRGPLRSI